MKRHFPLAAQIAALVLAACSISFAATETRFPAGSGPRDMTLDEAVQLAVRQNPQILASEQEIRRTRGVVLQVQAQALPQLTVGNSFTEVQKSLITSGGGSGGTSTSSSSTGGESSSRSTTSGSSGATTSAPSSEGASTGSESANNPMTQSWDVTVTASQLIYSGGQVSSAIHIAKYAMDATVYGLRDVVDTTIANVRSQFYAVLLDRAIIKVQQENINLLGSQLKDQQNRFEAGTVPRFNVLQAEVALANARPQLIQARNDYTVAELNLERSLGINTPQLGMIQPAINPIGDLTTNEKPEDLKDAMELARERRPFLKAQREQILIQVENIKVALAGYQPRLYADGGYELRNNELSKSLDNTVSGWFVGFTGSWNVFDGGATYGETKQAKAQLAEAKVSYDDAVRQVDVEVQQAYDQVIESEQTILSQQETISEAQEALRLSQEELSAGTGTQLNLLSAQVALLQSQTTLVQAQYNYNIAMAQFDRVTAANTRWEELFHDPMVDRQRAQEGLPNTHTMVLNGVAR